MPEPATKGMKGLMGRKIAGVPVPVLVGFVALVAIFFYVKKAKPAPQDPQPSAGSTGQDAYPVSLQPVTTQPTSISATKPDLWPTINALWKTIQGLKPGKTRTELVGELNMLKAQANNGTATAATAKTTTVALGNSMPTKARPGSTRTVAKPPPPKLPAKKKAAK